MRPTVGCGEAVAIEGKVARSTSPPQPLDGTVTVIEKYSGAVGLKQLRRNTFGSFTFQAATSGAVT